MFNKIKLSLSMINYINFTFVFITILFITRIEILKDTFTIFDIIISLISIFCFSQVLYYSLNRKPIIRFMVFLLVSVFLYHLNFYHLRIGTQVNFSSIVDNIDIGFYDESVELVKNKVQFRDYLENIFLL